MELKKLYTAVGRLEREANGCGHSCPVIVLGGERYMVDIQEMVVWTALNWRISKWDDISCQCDKLASSLGGCVARPWDACVNRLLIRGLLVSGCGETEFDALYDLLSSLGVIPTNGSAFVRGVSAAKLVLSRRITMKQAISVNHNLIYRVIDGEAGFHITTPKTASGTRTIPILYPQVAEQLRALIEVMDALYPEDLVMNGYHGFLFRNRSGYFLSAHNINRAIERISIAYNAEEMDQAELEDREPNLLPHFSVHNLRHTFCTRLCEKTNDIKFIQQVMGHADFSTTMDIYTHITQESMKEKAEVIKDDLVLM